MKAKLIYISFFIFGLLNSQIINGKIISKENNQPIPFAKIGVENENIGATANDNGNYTIDLTNVNRGKSIIVEINGYKKYAEIIDKFINSNNFNIILEDKYFEIPEVIISHKKFINKNWGINSKAKNINFGFNPAKSKNDFSLEFGTLFKNDKKVKIKKINLNLNEYKLEKPLVLKFNIYSSENGLPKNSLTNEDLIVSVQKDMIVDRTFTFDVSKKNLNIANQDFFVTIQILDGEDNWVYISGALFKNIYYRKYYGEWTKSSNAGPAINIDVKVEK